MMSSRNGGSSQRFSKRHFFHDLCRSTPGGRRLHQAMEDGVAMEAETYAEYDCSQWMQLVEADLVLVELAFVKNHGGHWKHESQLGPSLHFWVRNASPVRHQTSMALTIRSLAWLQKAFH